jgi:3-phenylpropionate/trans-cinnamate dioxygenase ferredoxin reductase component
VTEPGLVVVGSGPAGLTAAETFRTHQPSAPVHLLTEDAALPYERPPLSKDLLRGESEPADAALHPAEWFAENDIEAMTGHAVTAVDTAARTVTAGGETIPYRHLVLACGATPSAPDLPGGRRALQLRSLHQALALRTSAQTARSAVVIGAGFIGCEAAASLALRGLATTLVARHATPQARRLGERAGERLAAMVTAAGARYLGDASVEAVDEDGVRLGGGETVKADLVLAATGIAPNSALAAATGVRTTDGRIVVDAGMRTSVEDVYAAGDVALAYNSTAGRHLATEHWQDAIDQGEVAGAVAAGADAAWGAVPGFWSTIGDATLKYSAWGDGYDRADFVERGDGFTVWYSTDGVLVGVLTHEADDDYDRGGDLIAAKRPVSEVLAG